LRESRIVSFQSLMKCLDIDRLVETHYALSLIWNLDYPINGVCFEIEVFLSWIGKTTMFESGENCCLWELCLSSLRIASCAHVFLKVKNEMEQLYLILRNV
jgi:hypothetical protein